MKDLLAGKKRVTALLKEKGGCRRMSPKEAQTVEWKESWRDEYIRWICGFANAQGGRLIIGKSDKGAVLGVANAKKLLEDIPNRAPGAAQGHQRPAGRRSGRGSGQAAHGNCRDRSRQEEGHRHVRRARAEGDHRDSELSRGCAAGARAVAGAGDIIIKEEMHGYSLVPG